MKIREILFYFSIVVLLDTNTFLMAMETAKRKRPEEAEETSETQEPEYKIIKTEKPPSLFETTKKVAINTIIKSPLKGVNTLATLPIELRELIANEQNYLGDIRIFKIDKDIHSILDTNLSPKLEHQNLLSYLLTYKELAAAKKLFEIVGENLDVTSSDSLGYTPLMYAIMSEDLDLIAKIIATLTSQGFSKITELNRKNLDNTTPLILASIYHRQAIPMLIKSGADVDEKTTIKGLGDFTPLMILMRIKPFDPLSFKLLLSYNPNLYFEGADDQLYDSANYAILENNLEALKLLINDGKYDINHQGSEHQQLLTNAASFKNPKIVKFLVEKGIDVNLKNDRGETALSSILFDFIPDSHESEHPLLILIARYLLNHGATISQEEYIRAMNSDDPNAKKAFEQIFQWRENLKKSPKELLDIFGREELLDILAKKNFNATKD